MNKTPFFLAVIVLIILVTGVFIFSRPKNELPLPSPISNEYFFSPTCPHCVNVNAFIETWDMKDTFNMQKLSVDKSANSDLFLTRGKACGIRPSELGVPFLVTPEGKCLLGDEPIIEYLKNYGENKN